VTTTILLTGDIYLRGVTDPSRPFELVAGVLNGADVLFGNLEGCLYDSDEPIPYKSGFYHAGTRPAPALQIGGFHAVGCANNVTFGAEATVSTLARLDEMGIAHTGAGIDRASAHAPVVLDTNDVRVGFLQYSSVFWPIGHEAGDDSPGIAALEAHTAYQPHRRILEMPGGPPTVATWPDREYLKTFTEEVRRLKDDVDVVVVSVHWGITGSHETAQYQVAVGHEAVDAGADVVMGHGPHVIQAVEVYRDKPIFYSLGNFLFGWERTARAWVGLIVRVNVEDKAVVRVRCLPVRPNAEGQPTILRVDEEQPAIETLERLSRGYGTSLKFRDGEVVVWEQG
jgi:poly-gamma-glutamate synthesis protein (capsule biosynthesis protein)